jgi:hypothetical protein
MSDTALAEIAAENEIEPVHFGKFTFASIGLLVEGDPTFAEWQDAGKILLVMARGLQFAVGDWLNFGETRFGELAAQVIDARSWREETVNVYRWVAAKVPPENRIVTNDVSFSHHQVVASMPPEKQREWLARAASPPEEEPGAKTSAWSVAKLKSEIRREPNAPPKTYWVLVAAKDAKDADLLVKEMAASGRESKVVTK